MDGYGYQWRINPMCCKAQAQAAGDVGGDCPSVGWFWGFTVVAIAAALLVARPKGAR